MSFFLGARHLQVMKRTKNKIKMSVNAENVAPASENMMRKRLTQIMIVYCLNLLGS